MNSYKAILKNNKNLVVDLEIYMGFGLTLRKKVNLADIELTFGDMRPPSMLTEEIIDYCIKAKDTITISVDENDEVYVFNGVDNNHLNAVLVEKGYAQFI